MNTDIELYDGKTFKDLCKDIVVNSEQKKDQIDILVSELRPLIKTVNDAVVVVPLIKEYLDVSVKNDEQLTRLAAVFQRIMSSSTLAGNPDEFGLSAAEKDELMKEINKINSETVVPIRKIEK